MVQNITREKVLTEKYNLLVNVDEQIEGKLKIIRQVADKVMIGSLSIIISTEGFIKYWINSKDTTYSSIS